MHYAKSLFPIHIFQNNIKTNHILQDELLEKIEGMHQSGKMKVPEGWLTNKLSTSFVLQVKMCFPNCCFSTT